MTKKRALELVVSNPSDEVSEDDKWRIELLLAAARVKAIELALANSSDKAELSVDGDKRMQVLTEIANRLAIPDPEYPDLDTANAPGNYLNFMLNTRPTGRRRKSQWTY